MAWSIIAADEVLQEFTPAERAALKNIQADFTDVNLPAILARTVNAARGSIQAGGNTLGDANTIPDQLRGEIIAIARWKLLTAFPQMKALQTAERSRAARDATDLLQLIASQKPDRPRVEVPDGTSPITSPAILERDHNMDLSSQEGL
jgi:hypothetical protein